MGSGILISDLRSLGRQHSDPSTPWVYLGTRLRQREAAERLLGADTRIGVGPRLTAAMTALRQPFLDLVAAIGAEQADRLGWWSSRLSWRMWTTSDLFLLTCYLAVARDLACETRKNSGCLVVVVEDRWLLRQIREIVCTRTTVPDTDVGGPELLGETNLTGEKVRLLLLGAARRFWWLWRTVRDHLRQRSVWPAEEWAPPEHPTAAICSYPLRSSIEGASSSRDWEDHHLPGLDRILQAEGWQVMRFTPPDCPGFEKELAARASYFRPLILFASPRRIWRSLWAFWRPRWPGSPMIGDLTVGWLLRREWWLDVGRSSFCNFRLFYETLDALLSRGAWGWVVSSYENQPWEKMIALAAARHGVRICGIQTAILSPDYLPYVLGRGELRWMPLPDFILTSGPYAQEVLAEGGTPPDRLRMCGAIRYQPLVEAASATLRDTQCPIPAGGGTPARKENASCAARVLIVLPIYLPMCDDLLEAVRRAFPDGGASEGIEFLIRPHPLSPIDPSRVGFPARVLPSSFQDTREALRGCGVVLFAGSTVGFEAMALGLAALRYRPETTLDVDSDVYADAVSLCGERGLRESLLGLVRRGPAPGWGEQAAGRALQLFAPFNASVVRETFRRGKIENLNGLPLDDQLEPDTAGQRPRS